MGLHRSVGRAPREAVIPFVNSLKLRIQMRWLNLYLDYIHLNCLGKYSVTGCMITDTMYDFCY